MPPRRTTQKQVSVPVAPPVIVEARPQTTWVRRSAHSQHAAPVGECFDLATISGSEEEDQPPIGDETAPPENNYGINNPDIVVTRDSKNQAGDVHFFFEKLHDMYQCRYCR